MSLTINVVGLPAPQGSKRHVGNGVMVESSKKVAPWRQDVVAAAIVAAAAADWVIPAGAVQVVITFHMPRPRYHFRTGKRANELKPNAPTWVDKKPDVDKLQRSTYDALTTARVIRDDSQIARVVVEQVYANGHVGAVITITPLEET
jgi:crossover junction endodeoxyribonuclease RusA